MLVTIELPAGRRSEGTYVGGENTDIRPFYHDSPKEPVAIFDAVLIPILFQPAVKRGVQGDSVTVETNLRRFSKPLPILPEEGEEFLPGPFLLHVLNPAEIEVRIPEELVVNAVNPGGIEDLPVGVPDLS
jgi:hypothetical protein